MFGPILIVTSAILWALDGLLRRNLYSLPPLTIVTLEHFIGAILLVPILWFFRERVKQVTAREWSVLSFTALLSGLIGTVLFTAALLHVQYLPMSIVFLLQKLQPIFVFATAVVVLKERMSTSQVLWSILALVAGFFMTFPSGKIQFAGDTTRAALFAFGAAVAWGSATVFSRWLLLRLPANLTTTLRFIITTLLGVGALVLFPNQQAITQVTQRQIVDLFLIALSTGMVALAIYYQGLKRTNASTATILELFFPTVAVIIDSFVYQTQLSGTQYIAGAVLLFAAWKIARRNQQLLKLKFTSQQVRGDGRGKHLGYPTLNLAIPKQVTLAHGIYAAKVTCNGQSYQGALHFGPVPTFAKSEATLEIYLLNTTEVPKTVLTGKIPVHVEVVARLREIIRFDSKTQLVAQISNDVHAVQSLLSP